MVRRGDTQLLHLFLALGIFLLSTSAVAWQLRAVFRPQAAIPLGTGGYAAPFVVSVDQTTSTTTLGSGIFLRPAEQGVYRMVHVAVRNTDSAHHAVNESAFSLLAENGREYLPVCRIDFGSCFDLVPQTFDRRLVSAGDTATGVFVFDIPEDSGTLLLRVIQNPVSGRSLYFNVY